MSLINDALKDLETRQTSVTPGHSTNNVAPEASKGRRLSLFSLSMLMLLTFGLGFWGNSWLSNRSDNLSPVLLEDASNNGASAKESTEIAFSQAVVTEKTVADEQLVEKSPIETHAIKKNVGTEKIAGKVLANTDERTAPGSVPVESANAVLATENTVVDELNDLAARALLQDRLTRPEQTNAYALYRKVLRIAPQNEVAKAGVEKVKQRYRLLAKSAVMRGDMTLADNLMSRSYKVGLKIEEVLDEETTVIWREKARQGLDSKETGNAIAALDSVNNDTSPQAKTLQVSRSTHSLVEQTLLNAKRLLSEGRTNAAEKELKAFLNDYPQAEKVQVMLFDLYLDSGRDDKAGELLGQLQEYSAFTAYMQAKLMYDGNNTETVAQFLQLQPVKDIAFEKQNGFLAALFQKQGHHEEAAELYKTLLQRSKTHSLFWLGLAISSEQIAKPGEALFAYQQAVTLGDLARNIKEYAETRINALSVDEESRKVAETGLW